MSAGFKYNMEPEPSIEERYDVSTGVRRRGPYKLDTTNLVAGSFLPSFTPIAADLYNPQIQISAESETKRSIFREKDKTKRSKKESAQHSKSRNKSFVMTSVSAL